MNATCQKLSPIDSRAARVCQALFDYGTPFSLVDGGASYTDYSGPNPALRSRNVGEGDLSLDSQEPYQAAIRLAKLEFRRQANSPWIRSLHMQRLMTLPFLLDDGDPSTTHDDKLRSQIEGKISETRGPLTDVVAARLHRFFLSPPGEGGLGVVYDPWLPSEPAPVEAFRRVSGPPRVTCLGYAALYYGAAQLADLDVSFFEETRDGNLYHLYVGVRYDPGDPEKILFADPESMTLVTRERVLRDGAVLTEISELDFLAAFHTNRAKRTTLGGSPSVGKRRQAAFELERARRYAPRNPTVLYALGTWTLGLRDGGTERLKERAAGYFRSVLEIYPQFPGRKAIERFLATRGALRSGRP